MDMNFPKMFVPVFKLNYRVNAQVSFINENFHVFLDSKQAQFTKDKIYYLPFKFDGINVYVHKGACDFFRLDSVKYETNKDWGY